MDVAGAGAWSRWQRIGFRYLCLHWLLYAFTDPQGNPLLSLTRVLGFLLGKVSEALEWCGLEGVDLHSWTQDVGEGLVIAQGSNLDMKDGVAGPDQGWCLEFTTWLSELSKTFNGDEPMFVVHHQMTGSGDTMHDFVKLCAIVGVSLTLTIVWSLLDRSRGYPRLGRWVHLGARWYVALQLFGYGLAKFGAFSQFSEPGINALTREVGDHSPMGLVWTFMGANTGYKWFSGVGELLGFALLLHRRTTLLGCFVAVGVMANVTALNYMCGVPVKLYSTHLLLIPVALMAPFASRLWALFVSNRFSESVDIRVTHSKWLGWPLAIVGWLWALGLVWQGLENKAAMLEMPRYAKMVSKPELFGLWKVEKMLRDGEQVPMSDATRWEYFAIDKGGYAYGKALMGKRHSFDLEEDLDNDAIKLTPRFAKDAEAVTWSLERSVATRKVRNPDAKTREEWGGQIDKEVPAIVFKGTFEGQEIELHTVQKVFRLHDGFRLIREFPR